jgi:nucleotide-binding universal stress UspA family protein
MSACWRIDGAENEPGAVAARYCRYGDLAIVGQHDPEGGRVPVDFGAQVLLESGGPVLVVPFAGTFSEIGRRVVLAWDGSREAARALKDGLPLIQGTDAEVHVALVHRAREDFWKETRSGPSVTRLLASHGITAEREPVLVDETRDGVSALDAILNLASDVRADLVVMGARGRHGGPFPRASRRTRATLATMTAPVLLSA